MAKKKNTDNTGPINRLKTDVKGRGINPRVKRFPSILLRLGETKQLELTFISEIDMPNELSKVRIKRSKLSGRITKEEMQYVKTLFPNADIKINESRV